MGPISALLALGVFALPRRAQRHAFQKGVGTGNGNYRAVHISRFGVGGDKKPKVDRHFWQNDSAVLLDLYERARKAWRRQIKKFHTDKPDGTHEKAARLNGIMDRLEYLYRNHGLLE